MTEMGYVTRGCRWAGIGLLVSLGWAFSAPARAQLLDDIELRADQGIAEIHLRFSVPIRYLKHFPAERGELIKLYLQVLSLDGTEEREMQEYKRTPSIPQMPPFKVLYSTARSCLSVRDPLCLDIQFNQPVQFRIRQGEDGRSILLLVIATTDSRSPPAVKSKRR